jgi:myo-inositol 2-dehydrogenase/D-chiro-inositol 1-dehydrogenase
MTRIAVFGAGRIGTVHAANVAAHPDLELAAIVDPVAAAAEALAAATDAPCGEAAEVFADSNVAGVVIASATDTHAALLERAAEAGKAIFCEKPISLDFATAERVVAVVERAGVACMLGFHRRYDPNFKAVRDRIASGAAGPVEQIIMFTRDPAPPPIDYVRVSGGMFRDQAIHDFDMARYLLDEDIATVYAVASCLIDPVIGESGDVDSLAAIMTTISGKIVQLSNARRAPFGYDQRLEALCAKEWLAVDNAPQTTVRRADAAGFLAPPPENYFIERFARAYAAEIDAFARMIRAGEPPLAGLRDGLAAQLLAEAALHSATTGATVNLAEGWRPRSSGL